MARCLIIGCGCRGRMLAAELSAAGHAVRGTTRHPARLAAIEATGAEAVMADPDRVATLMRALERVTVAVILLGSAAGAQTELEALHGSRLEMLLTKLIDTTVRGVVYEAAGQVEPSVLAAGAERVRSFAGRTHAVAEVVTADPGVPNQWLDAAIEAVYRVLRRR